MSVFALSFLNGFANALAQYVIGTAIVLFATYLYSSQDRFRSSPVRLAEYEKTTIGGDPAFFDEPAPVLAKSTLKTEALSTSRPGTPTLERHHFRIGSDRK